MPLFEHDNGLGMDQSTIEGMDQRTSKGTGIGLPNVMQRMAYLGGANSFNIESSSEGTKVSMSFPIDKW